MSGYNDMIDAAIAELPAGDLNKVREYLEAMRPKEFFVQAASIFGHKARRPFVELRIHGSVALVPGTDAFVMCQWSPDEARRHALLVIEAAEAAEQDAFMVAFVQERLGGTLHGASDLLQEFRGFRAAQREKG